MEKFNLNESLRIYIPGLLLSILFYYLIVQKLEGVDVVLLPAIFIGFTFNLIFGNSHKKRFNKILLSKDYAIEWKNIVFAKLDLNNLSSTELNAIEESNADEMMNYVEFAFVSKKYNSPELAYFRYYKSIGVMYYNLGIVALIGIAISIGACIFYYNNHEFLIVPMSAIPFLGLFTLLSFKGSRRFIIAAIDRELCYWRGLNKLEVDELTEIVRLWMRPKHKKSTK